MPEINSKEKLEFEKALAQRNFEISNFWRRGWFFGALVGVLITGYFKAKHDESQFAILIAFVAFLVSIAQTLMNRGSKYWQERWEYVTKNREAVLGINVTSTTKYVDEKYYIEACIRAKGENWLLRSQRFSVSKLAILVWDIITFLCLCIWLNEVFTFFNVNPLSAREKIYVFHISLIIYLISIWWYKGMVYQRLMKSKDDITETKKNMKYVKEENHYINNMHLKRSEKDINNPHKG